MPASRSWLRLALAGAGLGLSFPPYPLPFLAWVALVPLLLRWDQCAAASLMLRDAFLAFLLTFAVAFYWPALHPMPSAALASVSGLLLLPMAMAVPFAAAVPVRRRLGRGAGLAALMAGVLVVEGLLSRGPFAFPWALLGHTQAEALRFNQFVAFTGVPGLSLWVLLLNGAGFLLARTRRMRYVGVLVVLLAVPFGVSQWRRAHIPAPVQTVRVGVVQPALGAAAWADLDDLRRIDTLLARSRPLHDARPALIVWPETALPPAAEAHLERLQAWSDTHHVALLTGAITQGNGPFFYNSALLFRPRAPRTRYDKHRLVPFAERVPLVTRFPWLRRFSVDAGGVAGYRAGPPPTVLALGTHRFGVMICFESLFGNHARAAVEQRADWLVTLTQDGWWGPTPGYRQHLAFTRLRAIETGRAVLQVSVTGMTALLGPTGASAFEIGWMERAARIAVVPVYDGTTFYVRHGEVLTGLAAALALLLAALTAASARGAKEP